jgi:Tfp pilus assembly protein PilF
MKGGKSEAAIEQFATALSGERDNQAYRLALGQAQAAAGRFMDAETTLRDLLERNGQDGPANLAMAHVLVKEGGMSAAFSYYHRAIYGQWSQNAAENRLKTRFELVDLLAAQKGHEGLLAELLPLQEEAQDDPATRMKIARLFVLAGSPARGAALFRDALQKQPHDPDAWAGLGETEFVRGNYRAAQQDYQNALRYRSDDEAIRQRAEVCGQVLGLDPTQRRIGSDEQLRRSVKLLQLTEDQVRACAPADLISDADKALKQRHPDLEQNLDLAGKLWQAGKGRCDATAPESLSLTLNKLAQ